MTMIPAYVCGNDLTLLTGSIEALFGESAAFVANELTQGFENETLRADQRLWELGRIAAADDEVRRALGAGDPPGAMAALRAAGRAPGFFAGVDAFLEEYGFRAEGWDIACPTWDEQRDGFWRQLAHAAADTTPAPRDAVAAAAARRRALVADIEQRLAADEAELARFRRRLARVEPYVAVREDRARWQVGILGALRRAALRRGQALVEGGLLGEAEDALFLVPSEIEAGGGDLRALVAARRAAHEAKCRLEPPRVVGAGPAPDVQTPRPTPEDGVLRGVGGSRGVVTGRARVIVDLEDADRLEVGDVLVCVMTSPPWTPLFGLAGGVVVDSGDLASHPAIAAREYGIPCVLGLAGVTTTIPDGAMVTVDGAAGTVQVLG
jgi:pyruvate,water dikinase